MRIKENDQVVVISGNDKGLRGKVLRVLPKKNRVVVAGVNVVKKHQRPKPTGGRGGQTQGGIIEFEAAIDVSNVMLVDPETDEPTRIGVRRTEDGRRIRYAKKSGVALD
ncbi:MAG: 50S ribosomal protein L24 [Ardenticatenaceae bacterium]|nr:50S ribosomal protein L24 [Ardenticatenaceae bacterium]MCB8991261.1 50S ribosomal protein L24 [Ardenticatenaceae bacterium]MCB9003698.1 50S ribosomal protein L24 [Ardenticatenaceae bacterium]